MSTIPKQEKLEKIKIKIQCNNQNKKEREREGGRGEHYHILGHNKGIQHLTITVGVLTGSQQNCEVPSHDFSF